MNKKEQRQLIKERLKNIQDKVFLDEKIYKNFILIDQDKENYFVYNSLSYEVDTKKIIEYLLKNNKKVYLPVIKNNEMFLVLVDENTTYKLGPYNVLEPVGETKKSTEVTIDVSITPLLGYDLKLNRLGKGGGYYDKFFSVVKCKKIGLAYKVQELDEVITNEKDYKLDCIINEGGIICE